MKNADLINGQKKKKNVFMPHKLPCWHNVKYFNSTVNFFNYFFKFMLGKLCFTPY